MIRGIVGGKRHHGQQQLQQGGALWQVEAVDGLDSYLLHPIFLVRPIYACARAKCIFFN